MNQLIFQQVAMSGAALAWTRSRGLELPANIIVVRLGILLGEGQLLCPYTHRALPTQGVGCHSCYLDFIRACNDEIAEFIGTCQRGDDRGKGRPSFCEFQ